MVERNGENSKTYNKNKQLISTTSDILNKRIVLEWLIVICFVIIASVSNITACYAKSNKINEYGYDKSGKWSYHITDSKNKKVEIRPATLEKPQTGINKERVTIPRKIKIGGKDYTVVKVSKCAFTVCICDACYNMGQSVKKRWTDSAQYGNDNIYQNYYKSVTELIIPDTVTNIDDYAFGGQKKLNRVSFSKSSKLERIGNYAFADIAIKELSVPSSVKTIGNNAFRECDSLNKLTFNGDSIKSIGENAFIEHNLTQLVIPESCTNIGNFAFADGIKLKTVTIKGKDISNYKKTLFDGTTIKEFYVDNYSVYIKLKKMFATNLVLLKARVISNQSLVHVQYEEITKDVYINKNQTLDYCNQCTFNDGRKLDNADIIEIHNFNGKEINEIKVNDKNYRTNGAPEVYIKVNDKEITYKIINNTKQEFIKNKESHYTCEIKNKSDDTWCYFDEVTFADIILHDDIQKPGYIITGYDVNGKEYKPGESAYGFGKNDNITCDYYYKPIDYKVRFDFNGGSSNFIIRNQNCYYGKQYSVPTIIPYNKKMKFEGWSTNKEGKGIIYGVNDTFGNLTTIEGETVVLYAIWSNNPVNITLIIDDDTTKRIQLDIDKCYADIEGLKREGYNFVGWKDDSGVAKSNDSTIDNYDHTLTACWKKIVFRVQLLPTGGKLQGKDYFVVSYGEKIKKIKKPTMTGYIFDGWYTDYVGGTKFNKDTVINKDLILYAHWKTIKVDLSVKPEGIKKATGYKIKCTVNNQTVYSKKIKKKNKKNIKYTFKNVGADDKLVIKVRCYKITKKHGKKKIKWYKWTTKKITVDY